MGLIRIMSKAVIWSNFDEIVDGVSSFPPNQTSHFFSPKNAMASKLLSQLRALSAASNGHLILARRFPNPGGAPEVRLFSNSPSLPEVSSSTPPPQISESHVNSPASSSLDEKELAKFSAIAETWSDQLIIIIIIIIIFS